MSHFAEKTHFEGSLKRSEGEFSILDWAVLTSVLFALLLLLIII